MVAIRSKESLQRLFQESKERQKRKKQLQQRKYKKAQQSVKKALADKQSKEQKKAAQNDWKQPQIKISRTIAIYRTKYVERFDDDDLFTTREELQQWEKEHRPCINWEVWDKLIQIRD